MNMRRQVIIAIVSVMLLSGTAFAHHPSGSAGLGQTGPVRTATAETQKQGTLSFSVQTEYIDLKEFSDSRLLGFSGRGKDAHTASSVFHSILSMGYGVTDDLTVSLKLPYERVNNIREAHSDEPGEIHVHGDSKGIGDLTVMAQYRILKTADDLQSAVFLGIKLPTGKTDVRDVHGEVFEAEFLPGTGSWNPIIGAAVTKRLDKISLDGSLQYTFATRGTQATDLGDIFSYNAAISYRAVSGSTPLDLILEANGEWKEKQKIRGEKDPNSGGNILFISPGIRFSFGRKFFTHLSVGVPLLQDMNGIQDDTKYRALFGISFAL